MNAPTPKVLIADDDASIRLVLSHAFTRAGFQVRATGAAQTLLKWASDGEGDVVVTDVVMPDENVFDVLPRIRAARPSLPIVVMSAQNTVLTAVAAAERGAFEYVPKPFDLDEIVADTRRAIEPARRGGRKLGAAAAKPARQVEPLLGRSAAMQGLYRSLARLVGGDAPTLVSGEPGSGRSLIARTLHDLGPQRERPFLAVACAFASPEEVSARLDREAAGGAVLLEGVDDAPAATQARLAAWFDEAAGAPTRSRPRVIATAGPDVDTRLADGRMRRELFDRIAVGHLRAPPLRDRPDDVPELARAVLAALGETAPALDPAAEARLKRHDWPGNVRELQSLVRRLGLMTAGPTIGVDAVEAELARPTVTEAAGGVDGALAEAVALTFANGAPNEVYDKLVHALERPMITAALAAGGGAQLRAAEILGLNRNTLRKKITDLGLR